MRFATGALTVASCLTLAAAGCARSPSAPSAGSSATIAGTAQIVGGGAAASGMSAASGLTVSIVGTSLDAVVDSTGYFQIAAVPVGTVQLLFRDAGVNATVQLSNVAAEQLVEIVVQLRGANANVVSEERTQAKAKIPMCHRTESGENRSYRSISVGQSAEPAHRAHGDAKVGEAVPGSPGKVFGGSCSVN